MEFNKMRYTLPFTLCLLLAILFQASANTGRLVQPEDEKEEFRRFCELGFMIRDTPEHLDDSKECGVTEAGEFNYKEDLPMLFMLIMMCTWGAIVRAVAKHFQIKTPYTVLLLISGAIIGGLSQSHTLCQHVHKYTAIARISPQHILYTFLPVLIFESAFSISVHTFTRSLPQILILAFPGMLLSTFATAIICRQFFSEYKWDFLTACLFGCIVSATDPVAVVAILRDLGVSEQLGVIIDGESLMNDGVAILLFEIFQKYLTEEEAKENGVVDIIFDVIKQFFWIAIGGPIWGWICARITIFLLTYVYNDAAVEISATICAAYLTYWSSEYAIHCSGVMAVVVLGVTLSAERTVISPESEGPVHHFWEMLGYLANTVLFVLVGIVITETAIVHFSFIDIPYLILLYIALHVVRFIMLLTFYPLLKRLGYGLEWQNLIVIMWGGLRGAVGICLALDIYEDDELCDNSLVGPKILFHTAGIVLLTLVINGTTTKSLLKTLKLTDVTVGQKEEMNNAVRRIRRTKWNLMRSQQSSRSIMDMDVDWHMVDTLCEISNPYCASNDNVKKSDTGSLQPPRPVKDNTTTCWHCSNIVENEPTIQDYREMTNDARLRAIKSMKIHYLHMYEKGTLTDQATQILLRDAEHAEDKYLHCIHAQNFHKYMKTHGFYLWLRDKVIVKFGLHKEESLPNPPDEQWRQFFYKIVIRDWFEALGFIVIVFNIIAVIWDVALIYTSKYNDDPCRWTKSEQLTKQAFQYTNYVFAIFYTIEFLIRILGTRLKIFFRSLWTYLDIVVLIVAYFDLYLGTVANDKAHCQTNELIQGNVREYLSLLKGLRLLQFTRLLRLLRPLVPQLLRKIKRQLNMQVFIGYDMGKGFVETSDAVIKFIPQIVENKKVQHVIKQGMKRERNNCVKDLALIHSKYPGVAVALKTRHACRAALNQMQFTLSEIRDGGLLDDTEYKLLKRILEEKMKRLNHSPNYIAPTKPLGSDQGFHHDDEDKKSNLSSESNKSKDKKEKDHPKKEKDTHKDTHKEEHPPKLHVPPPV